MPKAPPRIWLSYSRGRVYLHVSGAGRILLDWRPGQSQSALERDALSKLRTLTAHSVAVTGVEEVILVVLLKAGIAAWLTWWKAYQQRKTDRAKKEPVTREAGVMSMPVVMKKTKSGYSWWAGKKKGFSKSQKGAIDKAGKAAGGPKGKQWATAAAKAASKRAK